MAARSVRAVKASARVRRLTLVSPVTREELDPGYWGGVDRVVPAGANILESFARGVRQAERPEDPVLSVTGDLPLLTEEAVTDFVERCSRRSEADCWCGYVRQEVSEQAYPGLRHTWARFAEGTVCGTGMFMIRPRVLDRVLGALDEATRFRKSPVRMVRLLGLRAVIAFVFRRLTVLGAEQAGQRVLGVPCAAIESPFPETAFNVDDLPTLVEARRILGQPLPLRT